MVLTLPRLHRAGEDRSTQRRRRSAWEGGVDAPDRLKYMGVRRADSREAELLCQPLHSRTREGAEDRGVKGLQGIGAAGWVTIVRYGPQGPSLGAKGVWEERMGGDGDPPLLVDLGDGAAQGSEGANTLFQEEPEHVPLQRRDLLANDHLHAQLVLDRHHLCRFGRIDAVVIGDGNDIKSQLFSSRQHLRNTSGAIGGHRMNVQVGSPLHASHPSLCWAHDCGSSQIE